MNLRTTSASLAKLCSLPRGASTVSSMRVPFFNATCTRTMCRKFEPRSVIAGSCSTFTLRDSAMRFASLTTASLNWSTKTSPSMSSVATQNGKLSCAEVSPCGS